MGSAMIGVVVWADTAKSRAVIWCEDQRDLAYYLQQDVVSKPVVLQKGDLVEFESHYESGLRMAAGVQVVDVNTRPGLADALRSSSQKTRRNASPRKSGLCDTVHGDTVRGDTVHSRDTVYHGAQVMTLSIPERGEPERTSSTNPERSGAIVVPLFPELMRA